MHYEGFFCRLKFDESVFAYSANKKRSAAFFWSKSNDRIELPVNSIVSMHINSYPPFGRGLVFKIKSGYNNERIKTLNPMNITGVPASIINELQELVESNQKGQFAAVV